MLTLPAHATASQLLDPSDFKRLMLAALSALEELARTAANPIERRRAATTLLRALTARPPAPPKPTRSSEPPIAPRSTQTPTVSAPAQPTPTTPTLAHAIAAPLTPVPCQAAPPIARRDHPTTARDLLRALGAAHSATG